MWFSIRCTCVNQGCLILKDILDTMMWDGCQGLMKVILRISLMKYSQIWRRPHQQGRCVNLLIARIQHLLRSIQKRHWPTIVRSIRSNQAMVCSKLSSRSSLLKWNQPSKPRSKPNSLTGRRLRCRSSGKIRHRRIRNWRSCYPRWVSWPMCWRILHRQVVGREKARRHRCSAKH